MRREYTEQDRQAMWEHEATIREIVLGQGPIRIVDLSWHMVLPPPDYTAGWTYPAIAAVTKPGLQDYAVLVTKAAALLENPLHLRIVGFDSTEARALGLDLEADQPGRHLNSLEVEHRLAHAERGAYFCFYVTPDKYITAEQPPIETYAPAPTEHDEWLTLRALAAWRRNSLSPTIPNQGGNRLIPASDITSFLPR